MTGRPARRVTTAMAVVLLGVLGWLVAGPKQLGGPATYVVTRGRSMEPAFRTGDLAVVRHADRYAVGDVVAYRSATTGTAVLHRIVGVDGERFVLKGDSNAWLDPETVPAGAITGRLAVRVPGGGKLLGLAKQPFGAAGLLILLVTTTTGAARPRRAREDAMLRDHRVAGAAAATALLAAAAGLAYATPATAPGTRDTGLRHETSLDYEAAVAAGPVYQDGRISTGDPVFRGVAPEVGVRVGYRLIGGGPETSGTIATEAVVKDESGWSHRIPLGPSTRFTGPTASVTSALEFGRLDALVADVARRTGVPAGAYTVSLGARISVAGTGGFAATVDAPGLELLVDRGAARPVAAAPRPALAVSPVSVPGDVPASMTLAGRRIGVGTARTAATGLAAVAALVTVGLAVAAGRRRRRPEPERLAAEYAGRLVDVRAIHVPADRNVVEVADVQALVKVADRFGRPILHEVRGATHTYVVENDRSLYRYRGTPVPVQRAAAEPVAVVPASAR